MASSRRTGPRTTRTQTARARTPTGRLRIEDRLSRDQRVRRHGAAGARLALVLLQATPPRQAAVSFSVSFPAARSAVPEATAKFTFQDAYSTGRENLAALVKQKMAERIAAILKQYGDRKDGGILIQEVFLRKIELPPNLKQAIEAKMQADQEAQRMQFVLDREKREAERKRIEAQGIRDFQATVSEGIGDKLLQWKGIEATEKLAQSANAKVVVVGSGRGGVPVILNPGAISKRPRPVRSGAFLANYPKAFDYFFFFGAFFLAGFLAAFFIETFSLTLS